MLFTPDDLEKIYKSGGVYWGPDRIHIFTVAGKSTCKFVRPINGEITAVQSNEDVDITMDSAKTIPHAITARC